MISRRILFAACFTFALSPTVIAAEPIPVTVSFSILADVVKVIGGERVQVTTLVGANQDAHVFEPKPSHAKTLQQSRLLVINGLDFEPWAKKLARSANFRGTTVVASQGITPIRLSPNKNQHGHHGHHHGVDPHAWQNPQNMLQYTRNIATALSTLDPDGQSHYERNAQAYQQALQELDQWAQQQILSIPEQKRKVITSHDAFTYLAARYQIQVIAAHGLSTAAQPSAKHIAQLIRQIQRDQIQTIFIENTSNPKLMQQISQDTGAKVGAKLYSDALSGLDEPGATYLSMMRHNITQLAEGMR
jgi:zinc/manganese transport system substrate-binding protein